MSAPELHADDLLDREARGSLSAAERERLLAHVSVCSVCRFERQVRADFRAEFASLSAPQHAPTETPGAKVASLRASRPPARAPWTFALMAGAWLLAGAAAAELTGVRVWSFVTELAASSHAAPSASAAQAPRAPRRGSRKPSEASPLVSSSANEQLPSAAPIELVVSPPSMPSSSATTAGRSSKSAASSAHPDAPAGALLPGESARALLGEAGAARERGDYELAARRYRELLRLYPGTVHAAAAHAILGRLLLDRGDPSGALPHFDAYLASGAGSLAEEALLGRALAFGQLGQAAQESSAWQALLASYPGSLHAARAKQRLAVLQAR